MVCEELKAKSLLEEIRAGSVKTLDEVYIKPMDLTVMIVACSLCGSNHSIELPNSFEDADMPIEIAGRATIAA